jgi:hypothetical protein
MKTPIELLKETLDSEIKLGTKMIVNWDMYLEKEKEQSISILTKYHNSLFSLPLKDGEAEAIYNHIVNTNKMV